METTFWIEKCSAAGYLNPLKTLERVCNYVKIQYLILSN